MTTEQIDAQVMFELEVVNPIRRELDAYRVEQHSRVRKWEREMAVEHINILKRNLYRWEQELKKGFNSEIQKRYTWLKRLIMSIESDNRGVDIEDIKSIPIQDILIGHGITPKMGFIPCPHHLERTASCKIYEKTNSYYCFGCGKGGSVIDLVMGLEGVEIKKAISILDSYLN